MIVALYDVAKLVVLKLFVLLDAVRRILQPIEGKIIRQVAGDQIASSQDTLCLFSHFDRDGIVDDYVVQYLQALDELGCETIFVSTAEQLSESEITKIKRYCRLIIVKQNIGYDFASWRTGIEAVGDISGYDRVVVVNDSVYGPLQDLHKTFADMGRRDVDFWGITESLRYGRHLQSYFLVFERPVLRSEMFREFWRKLPDYRNKHVVIIQCEVGLSRALASSGFRFAAYCPVELVQDNLRRAGNSGGSRLIGMRVNPTHRGWRALVADGCPFLKVQLLRDNPQKVPDLDMWREVLAQSTDYDLDVIGRHLARMKSNGERPDNGASY